MSTVRRILLTAFMAGSLCLPSTATAQPATPGPCVPGRLPSKALSLICVPTSGWKGELVVFAHGYIPVGLPLGFYNLTLPDGTTDLPTLIQSLGYAFATTSYRISGRATTWS